ncbi:hypothetical protein E2C01_058052 [Portunus trituberculatus]|uniref:Uncharacterized protein n=1 Tax=Portunus trituberculatus TaxID=210409 RepID=A0A5B7H2Q7_PORTR|nr:hypothetical protein [Portunus trituberculatus]
MHDTPPPALPVPPLAATRKTGGRVTLPADEGSSSPAVAWRPPVSTLLASFGTLDGRGGCGGTNSGGGAGGCNRSSGGGDSGGDGDGSWVLVSLGLLARVETWVVILLTVA